MYKWCYIALVLTASAVYNCTAQKPITLEDIWQKGTFRGDFVAGFSSMADGQHYVETNSKGELEKFSFKDGTNKGVIADLRTIVYKGDTVKVEDFSFDSKEQNLLLFEDGEQIYRHSAAYNVYLYNIATKAVTKVGKGKILHATLNPQSTQVAYVDDNNLFVYDLATKTTARITSDGKRNYVSNGNCDWVYEEEFSFTKAFQWSNNGKYIAYYKFDESEVKQFNFAQYGTLYPNDYVYKYPKAGEDNSKVSIHVYDIATQNNTQVDLGTNPDIYVPRIYWTKFDNTLHIYKLNRLQNELIVYANKPGTTATTIDYQENDEAYVDITDDVYYLQSQNGFIYKSEKDGYNHLYLRNLATRKDVQITTGKYEVISLLGVDEKAKQLYYLSSESSPLEKKLYRINLDGTKKVCLTPEAGVHSINLSSNYMYFLDGYSKLNMPPTYTMRSTKDAKFSRVLKDNASLAARLTEYQVSPQEVIRVPNGLGDTLYGWMIKPKNMDPSKKYPLLMFQYSGPGSQQVTNSYMGRDYWWYQMLAQQGYAVACVDGRGTGARGEAWKKITYKQLGKYESDDQIAAAKYFGSLPFIDKGRIGIWGWSYGGYMSSICIMKGADVFKTAIAVAPVTNWRYYDNIYTERYMAKPQDNASGYDDNSPVNMVNKLKGNYLLIHGTADDNVHFQNSVEMVNALVKANKQFDFEMYPDRNHGISGGVTRLHLYKKMTDFLLQKL
ncbi:MAG: hypothetical protein RL660_365 [Bacteroidota bacterium]|jgi:dipeptidyl-peptidase-4